MLNGELMPITACIAMTKVIFGKYGIYAVRRLYILRKHIKNPGCPVVPENLENGKGGPVAGYRVTGSRLHGL
jgi:hypothetical protein